MTMTLEPPAPSRGRTRSSLSFVGQVISWLVILGVVAVLAVAVIIPRLAGATPYTILTGSMKPNYPPGTLVVVKPVPIDQIGIGTVITYQLTSGEPQVVTHRVVAQGVNSAGEHIFQTQGDANPSPDEAWVLPVQIKGAVWYAVPHLGHLNSALDGQQHQRLVYLAAAGLGGYALLMFGGSAVEAVRRRSGTRS